MIAEIAKELKAAKTKLAELEVVATKQSAAALSGLPKEFGFSNVEEFIAALKEANPARGRGRKAKKAAGTASKPGRARKRARITPETKERVKTMAGEGSTGAAIAKALGISVPSVQNIKKELGLVKSRKK